MNHRRRTTWQFLVLLTLAAVAPGRAQLTNGNFETGDFTGWTADPNWVIAPD